MAVEETTTKPKMSRFSSDIAGNVMTLEKEMLGAEFWISTTIISRGIFTTTFNLTGASTGDLVVEDVIFKTDNVGLAGGGTFKIVCNNIKGTSVIAQEGVPMLGAFRTHDLGSMQSYQADKDASGGSRRSNESSKTILESGKVIGCKCSDTDCTGTGRIDVYIKFRRLSVNANLVCLLKLIIHRPRSLFINREAWAVI